LLAFLVQKRKRRRHFRAALSLAAFNTLCGALIAVPVALLLGSWKPTVIAFFAGVCWRPLLKFCVKKFHDLTSRFE